jgi:hypothetical protein
MYHHQVPIPRSGWPGLSYGSNDEKNNDGTTAKNESTR